MSDTATLIPAREPLTPEHTNAPAGWAADWTPAQRQRASKLVRQYQAAIRLINNAPARLGDAPWTPTGVTAGELWPTRFEYVDGHILRLNQRIQRLHAWRGHTASLPADKRPTANA